MSDAELTVRPFVDADGPALAAAFQAIGWAKDEALFHRYLADQAAGLRVCIAGEVSSRLAGYVTVSFASEYLPFAEADIPEIADLNVLPPYRRHGLGASLMHAAEQAAGARGSPVVGLGVGLYADYGSAQRLYVRRGYVPDGEGVVYAFRPVAAGEHIRIDDDAILMMTKQLSP